MKRPVNLSLESLKRLPRIEDTWQLGLERMPQWIVEHGKPPVRPFFTLCRSARTGAVGTGDLVFPGDDVEAAAFAALASLSRQKDVGYRPRYLEIRDTGVEQALRPFLPGIDIDLRVSDRLDLIDEILVDMTENMAGPFGTQSLFHPDVGLEGIRSFAEAARLFYLAAPWNHLSGVDLVHVESAVPNPGLEWFTVMGCVGLEYGLAFHASQEAYHDFMAAPDSPPMRGGWVFSFEPIHHLPIKDSELWEVHGLPLASDQAYPLFVRMSDIRSRSGSISIPATRDEIRFMDGLLRALAGTTEDEMDAGRWTKHVLTADGAQELVLSLPGVLDPKQRPSGGFPFDRRFMEKELRNLNKAISERNLKSEEEINAFLKKNVNKIPASMAETPEEKAQELFYESLDAVGRRRIKLAREALRLWPDCADACVLLGEEMPDPGRQLVLFRNAVEAAKRVLGPTPFQEDVGHFWGIVENRPYARALSRYAECLWVNGQSDEAIRHWTELMRLDAEDHQGIRLIFIPKLLQLGRDEDAWSYLDAFKDDGFAITAFARALADFRRNGPGESSTRALQAAIRRNPHVPKYLLGNAEIPEELPERFEFGGEDEAVLAALELLPAWEVTPEAMTWLRKTRRDSKPKGRKSKLGGKKPRR